MDRLTVRGNTGDVLLKGSWYDFASHSFDCETDEGIEKLECALKNLKEYEDLEEQCAKENGFCLRMLLQKWKEFIDDIQELYGYRKLEEQGRLLKLPCAVGDTIFHLCRMDNNAYEIIEMKVGCVEPCGAIRKHKGVAEIWNVYAEADYTKGYFKFFDFGREFFLLRKEAEAALKELTEGK